MARAGCDSRAKRREQETGSDELATPQPGPPRLFVGAAAKRRSLHRAKHHTIWRARAKMAAPLGLSSVSVKKQNEVERQTSNRTLTLAFPPLFGNDARPPFGGRRLWAPPRHAPSSHFASAACVEERPRVSRAVKLLPRLAPRAPQDSLNRSVGRPPCHGGEDLSTLPRTRATRIHTAAGFVRPSHEQSRLLLQPWLELSARLSGS